MSLREAVLQAGTKPLDSADRAAKKRYSELLSHYLAIQVAEGMRNVGFVGTKPQRDGPGEKAFQGGLGPKKVDVSYSDERHGLLAAVSVKTISFQPFGKNLKNRFSDLTTESITLHMRFPYSVVCALFAMPSSADLDKTQLRPSSTFQRATRLLATISGRAQYTDPGEKFENVTMMLYEPATGGGGVSWVRLFNSDDARELTEEEYFEMLLEIYNTRNPHALIEEEIEDDEGGD